MGASRSFPSPPPLHYLSCAPSLFIMRSWQSAGLHGRRTRGVRGGYGPPTFHDRTHPLLDYAIEQADLTCLYELFAWKLDCFHLCSSFQRLLSALQSSPLLLLFKFSAAHDLVSRFFFFFFFLSIILLA